MRQDGFSLPELLAVLMLTAILLGAAVPSLRALALDARRTADVNALVGAVQLARSEAAKRAGAVTLCPSADGTSCLIGEPVFDFGWIVYADPNERAQPVRPEDILVVHEPAAAVTIRANRDRFRFRTNYRRGTNGTIRYCDRRGSAAARAVIVSYTGRPRVAATTAGGEPLPCPP